MNTDPKNRWEYYFTFTVDFSSELSKNRMWLTGRGGRRYLNPKIGPIKNEIIRRVQNLYTTHAKCPFVGKLWVSLKVYKPNHRSDALNFVDVICDCLQAGAGIDDRWFCLEKVDWEISKKDPRIEVSFGQQIREDCFICPGCERILSESNRYRKSRLCKKCHGASEYVN